MRAGTAEDAKLVDERESMGSVVMAGGQRLLPITPGPSETALAENVCAQERSTNPPRATGAGDEAAPGRRQVHSGAELDLLKPCCAQKLQGRSFPRAAKCGRDGRGAAIDDKPSDARARHRQFLRHVREKPNQRRTSVTGPCLGLVPTPMSAGVMPVAARRSIC